MAALSKTPETIYGRYIMRNFVARDEKADAEQIESRMRNWEMLFKGRDE